MPDRGSCPSGPGHPVPDQIEGPSVVVRRVVESSDPFTVPTLHMALDSFIGGTIEVADEGPLFNDDFRVAGETRLIRARPGYRPIVRVERSSSTAVRNQRAVFVLDRQNLTLDGIDLIVDVRDLSPEQNALFWCSGANLTLRNCSITVLNDNKASFCGRSVPRADTARPTRIRLEQTLVRGQFAAGIYDLAGGSAALALDKSRAPGRAGPLDSGHRCRIRPSTRRFFVGSSILAGPGPIIQWSRSDSGPRARPLAIRAFGSVFGRLHGSASPPSSPHRARPSRPRNRSTGEGTTTSSRAGRASSPAATIPWSPLPTWPRFVPRGTGPSEKARRFSHPGRVRPISRPARTGRTRAVRSQSRKDLAASRPAARGPVRESHRRISAPAIPQPLGWALDRSSRPHEGTIRVNAGAAPLVNEGRRTGRRSAVRLSATDAGRRSI